MHLVFLTVVLFSFPALAGPSDPAEKCRDAQSNAAGTNCLAGVAQELQEQLEKTYAAAAQRAQEYDEFEQATPHAPNSEYTNLTLLEKSKKSFDEYLNIECDRIRSLYGTGTGAGSAYFSCQIDLLTNRINALKIWE